MTTSDANGMPVFTGSDQIAPLEPVLNLISAAASNALDVGVRPFIVANLAARDALKVKRGATKAKPLLVYRQDLGSFELDSGSGWAAWPPPPPSIKPQDYTTKAGVSGAIGTVNQGAAKDVSVSFGTTLDNTSNWIPIVSLIGARGHVDRLTSTISSYSTTGMNVVIKNYTTGNSTGDVKINWALIKKSV